MNSDEYPTIPIPDDVTPPEPAAATASTPEAPAPPPARRSATARPLLIGAAAGIGALLIGGLGIGAVAAINARGAFQTVPAADASGIVAPTDDTAATAAGEDEARAAELRLAAERRLAELRAAAERAAADPQELGTAIVLAVVAAGGVGASSVEVESSGWSVDVVLADGSEVDVRVALDGTTTVRADHRDDDSDPVIDTSRIADIARAAIGAVGGVGAVVGIETDRDDSHAFDVLVDLGNGRQVGVELADDLTVIRLDLDD